MSGSSRCSCFDKLSTNGFFPFALSLSKGERLRRLARFARNVVLVAAFAAQGSAAAAPLELTPEEQAGQRIYLNGESPSGARISARIGIGGMELTGRNAACGNCHGEDGRGRAEGGVEPLNVQWGELTKPYGHRHRNGRNHAAFDEPALKRTVTEGVDPDGNKLDGAMPRFSMSAKDFSSLVAYLKKLEAVRDPGVTADALRIGTLLPTAGPLKALGDSLRTLYESYFAALNERGGVHGRRLTLVVESLPIDRVQARSAARALLAERDVFAVLAPLAAGIEADLADAASSAQVPVVGPITLFPEDVRASNPYVFHLLPGIAELAQVLVRHAGQSLDVKERPVALWHADTESGRDAAQALAAEMKRSGWRAPTGVPMPPRGASHESLAASMKERGFAAVIVVSGGADVRALAAAGARIGWTPYMLLPGALAPRDIVELPSAFRDRVLLAYPSAPDDQRVDALREYMTHAKDASGRANQPLQIAGYSAGLLLVEALKRTGRDVTRRKLVATLETVQSFDTGLVPQLTYNADRRIGALGGYVVAVDLEHKGLKPLGGYVKLP